MAELLCETRHGILPQKCDCVCILSSFFVWCQDFAKCVTFVALYKLSVMSHMGEKTLSFGRSISLRRLKPSDWACQFKSEPFKGADLLYLLPVFIMNHNCVKFEGLQCCTEQLKLKKKCSSTLSIYIIRYPLMAVQTYLHNFYWKHKFLQIFKKDIKYIPILPQCRDIQLLAQSSCNVCMSVRVYSYIGVCVTFLSLYTYNAYWKDLCS